MTTRRQRHLIAYAASILSLILFQLFFFFDYFTRMSDFRSDIVFTLVTQIVCMGVIPFTVLTALNRGRVAESMLTMRYKAPRDAKTCLLLCLGLALLITPFTMTFNALSNLLLRVIGYKRAYPAGTIYLGAGDFFLMILMTGVLPAVFEEYVHRGVLLSGLQDRGSEFTAIVLSSVMFALMHENPAQLVYAFFGGLLFGAVVVKTDSMIPAMTTHFANNVVAVILDYSTQRQNALGVWYDKMTGSASILSIGITFAVLALSLFGVAWLLQYIARKAPKPVSEKKLLGVMTVDAYSPNGKATLRDNAILIALMIAEGLLTFGLLLWGIAK